MQIRVNNISARCYVMISSLQQPACTTRFSTSHNSAGTFKHCTSGSELSLVSREIQCCVSGCSVGHGNQIICIHAYCGDRRVSVYLLIDVTIIAGAQERVARVSVCICLRGCERESTRRQNKTLYHYHKHV